MTPSTTRLLAKTTSKLCSLPIRSSQQSIRSFSQTCLRQDEPPARPTSLLTRLSQTAQTRRSPIPPPLRSPNSNTAGGMTELQRVLATGTISRAQNQPTDPDSILGGDSAAKREEWGPSYEPFHFHIYAHKHNTHITVTKPNRGAILSLSTGNIGFKKSKRGTYDAAYQLCAYVLDKLNQGGWHRKITALEVVLRGFGAGREAATKVLLGNEGRLMRPHIRKVSDATRLKFGGTRSPKPRRLG
ncbi:hypothetical protein F5Y19DRAFT_51731 [Xylariaceae sp. FL1651]|nr:hypothetical protein F5Y19DRAFT_51731 [Xylariaceae sp. FL1651]